LIEDKLSFIECGVVGTVDIVELDADRVDDGKCAMASLPSEANQ
jgi:hypothetical protein